MVDWYHTVSARFAGEILILSILKKSRFSILIYVYIILTNVSTITSMISHCDDGHSFGLNYNLPKASYIFSERPLVIFLAPGASPKLLNINNFASSSDEHA